jgi:hypothetical protein
VSKTEKDIPTDSCLQTWHGPVIQGFKMAGQGVAGSALAQG